MNKQRSNFIYLALGQTKAFSISRKFIEREIFPKHMDFMTKVRASSFLFYNKWIYKPILEHRRVEMDNANRKKQAIRMQKSVYDAKMVSEIDKVMSLEEYRYHYRKPRSERPDMCIGARLARLEAQVSANKAHIQARNEGQIVRSTNPEDYMDLINNEIYRCSKKAERKLQVVDKGLKALISQVEMSNI